MTSEFIHPSKSIEVIQIDHGQRVVSRENVVSETSVSLTVNGNEWFNFLCTPLDLDSLAAGFLFSSQIIRSRDEIKALKVGLNGCGMDVWLSHAAEKPLLFQRNSGCSGGISVPEIELEPLQDTNIFKISLAEINQILAAFYQNQQLYQSTGGVHTSALFSGTDLRIKAEDIGRHNTLDKIAGRLLLSGEQVQKPILVTTGRVSLEMMQKAAMIRACFVISRTSATTASVELAEKIGICLIGYAQKDRLKVYTRPDQVLDG